MMERILMLAGMLKERAPILRGNLWKTKILPMPRGKISSSRHVGIFLAISPDLSGRGNLRRPFEAYFS